MYLPGTKPGSNDEVSNADFEQPLPWCALFAGEADLLEDHVLVKVNTIETGRG